MNERGTSKYTSRNNLILVLPVDTFYIGTSVLSLRWQCWNYADLYFRSRDRWTKAEVLPIPQNSAETTKPMILNYSISVHRKDVVKWVTLGQLHI